MAAKRKNALNRMLRKCMDVNKTAFSELKKLSTSMEPYESCTHTHTHKIQEHSL